MSRLPLAADPRLLVGLETSDDAGVVRLTEDIALVQTVDFFTPIVNDPYSFGQAAAANALSDVYAMGATPFTAMNIVCFPAKGRDMEELYQILRGGLDKIREAGAILAGGHSVDDQEIKYGLSVTGLVHPDKVVTNAKARPGQVLILSKPLGTGILATALKGNLGGPDLEKRLVELITQLNDQAAAAMVAHGVEAATDITGFGLLGHGLEMARASRVDLVIQAGQVPVIPEVKDLARMGLIPGGTRRNQSFCAKSLIVEPGVDDVTLAILADAQTSGGLLMAAPPDRADDLMADLLRRGVQAASIGRVEEGEGRIRVRP